MRKHPSGLLASLGLLLLLISAAAQAQTTLFGSTASGELFAVDVTTGRGIQVGALAAPVTAIELDNITGRAFFQEPIGTTQGREFDITNAAPVGAVVPNGFVFDALEVVGGVWYGTAVTTMGGSSELRTLDPFAGTTTVVGPTGFGPISGLAFDGSTLYGIAGGPGPAMLYTVDPGTGSATGVGSTGIEAGGLEFGPDGRLYAGGTGANRGDLYVIDTGTGLSTFVGSTGFGTATNDGITGLTLVDDTWFGCTTALYVARYDADIITGETKRLEVVNPADGIRSSSTNLDIVLSGLAAHPITCALWGTTPQWGSAFLNPYPGNLYRIDRATGAASRVGDVLLSPADIAFGPDGTLYGFSTDTEDIIKIDLGTGAGTVIGDSGLSGTEGNGLAERDGALYLMRDRIKAGGVFSTLEPASGVVTSSVPLSGHLADPSWVDVAGFSCSGVLFGYQSFPGDIVTYLVTIEPDGLVTSLGLHSLPGTGKSITIVTGLAWTCPRSGKDFFTLDPCRAVDTRNPDGPLGGPALVAGTGRLFPLAGSCGVPETARAVSVNLAITGATADGNLRLYPGRSMVPTVSTINYVAGQTRSNNAVLTLNELGELAAFVGQVSGTVNVIIDVNGYFE